MVAQRVDRKVDRMEGRLVDRKVDRKVDQMEVPKVDQRVDQRVDLPEERVKAKPGASRTLQVHLQPGVQLQPVALVEVSNREKLASMEGRASPRLLRFQRPEPVLRRLG